MMCKVPPCLNIILAFSLILCILFLLYECIPSLRMTAQAYLKPETWTRAPPNSPPDSRLLPPGSPAGIRASLAVATTVKLPFPIQHGLEVAALEPRHQAVVGARLVPEEKRTSPSERTTETPKAPAAMVTKPGHALTDLDSRQFIPFLCK